VEQLLAQGLTLYRLGLGEPDFPTPDHVKAAAIEAIRTNRTGYTSTGGILALRQAIVSYLRDTVDLHYEVSETAVSVGAKHSLFNAIVALCRTGDEVLIPIPYWVSFPEQVRFAGGTPVFIPSGPETGHKVTPEALSQYVSPNTRLLILNSPNNPSGAVYSATELEAIARFCIMHDIWVISDEVYSAFTYTAGGHVSIASFPGMRERAIVINAVSKTYGMTGWRIGYAAAPAGNPNSIAQHAAIAALSGGHGWLDPIRKEYEARRRRVVDGVRTIRGLTCDEPEGAFFLWVDASYWSGRHVAGRTITGADDLAAVLLEEAGVVVMPGTAAWPR
jgi:aspartate aminotransferase